MSNFPASLHTPTPPPCALFQPERTLVCFFPLLTENHLCLFLPQTYATSPPHTCPYCFPSGPGMDPRGYETASPSFPLIPPQSYQGLQETRPALEVPARRPGGPAAWRPSSAHTLRFPARLPQTSLQLPQQHGGWVLMSQLVELNFLCLAPCPPRSPNSEPVYQQFPTGFPFPPPQFFPITAGAEVVCLGVSIEAAVRLFAFGLGWGKPPGPSSPSIWLRGLSEAVAIGISHAEVGW